MESDESVEVPSTDDGQSQVCSRWSWHAASDMHSQVIDSCIYE